MKVALKDVCKVFLRPKRSLLNFLKRDTNDLFTQKFDITSILTTTVKVSNSKFNRLTVKTEREIPKVKMMEFMELLQEVEVTPPIRVGDIIVENILGLGVNVVATRTIQFEAKVKKVPNL